jgi:protein SPA2
MTSPGSNYDDYPSSEYNAPYSRGTPSGGPARRISEDRAVDSGYGASSPVPVRKSIDDYGARRSEDGYGGESYPGSGSRRRPSQDTSGRRSADRDRDLGRRPSQSVSVHSDSTSTTNAQSATAGMIIPNKSTIAEEEIEVPYGREIRDSTGTAVDERDRSKERGQETDTDAENDDLRSPASGLGGLSGLTARLQADDDEDDGMMSGTRSADDYYDKMSFGRASVTSDRSAGGRMSGRVSVGGGGGGSEDSERIRRDYEFKIATMQTRITGLERDLESAQMREQDRSNGDDRVRMLETELEELRRVSEHLPELGCTQLKGV